MAMQVASGDRESAVETLHSVNLLIAGVSLVTLLAAVLLAAFGTLPSGLSVANVTTTKLTLLWLCVYAILTMQSSNLVGVFRCDGNFSLGVVCINCIRIAETLIIIPLALSGKTFPMVAFGMAACRAVGMLGMIALIRKKSPWLTMGFRKARLPRMRKMLFPAAAFMAFPLGNALNLQGLLFVIGIAMGPVAVASFSTLRTMTRIPFQFVEVVKNGSWPEFSVAYGKNDMPLARQLHRGVLQVCLWTSIAGSCLLLRFGDGIIRLWTQNRIVVNHDVLAILLTAAAISSIWNASSVALIAGNTHSRIAFLYAGANVISLWGAYLLMPHFGINIAPAVVLVVDVAMSCYVLRRSSTLLSDRPAHVIGSTLNVARIIRQAFAGTPGKATLGLFARSEGE
jgi:O-antigen/teichoic acid export membrane protein